MNMHREGILLTPTLSSQVCGGEGDGRAGTGSGDPCAIFFGEFFSPLAQGEGMENFVSAEYLQEIEMRLHTHTPHTQTHAQIN
jgi:hypothetical protein